MRRKSTGHLSLLVRASGKGPWPHLAKTFAVLSVGHYRRGVLARMTAALQRKRWAKGI